jgi:hypothetical protein
LRKIDYVNFVAERASPESITTAVSMDSGPAPRGASRNDGVNIEVCVVTDYVVEFGKDGQPVEPDGRLDAAAFHRNHQPIWAVLQKFLDGKSGDVLEAGSGTGQHVVDFACRSP